MPLASSTLRTTVQRAGDGEDEDDDGEAPVQRSLATPGARTTSAPALPVLPVSRSVRDGAASAPTGGHSAAASGTASTAGTASTGAAALPVALAAGGPAVQRAAGPTIRPIAAHNPLRPSVALQRDADDDAGDGDGDGDSSLPSPWWAPASEASAASPGTLAAATGPGAGPAVQRSAFAPSAGAPAPLSPVTAIRSAASSPTWSAPGVQRSARSGTAAPRLPLAVPPAPAPAPAAFDASGAPTWAPGTSVTFPQRSITSDPVVQTSRAGGSGPTYPTATPTVQRDPNTSSSTTTSTTSTAAPGPTSGKGGHSERELDDLARQLFGRIRTRLRADLLQDREASGFTFDNV